MQAARIEFPFSSVGATENALLAAVLAKGTTYLINCAVEPEITHLCYFLQAMGAEIGGIGTAGNLDSGRSGTAGCGISDSGGQDRGGNLSVCCGGNERAGDAEKCSGAGNAGSSGSI